MEQHTHLVGGGLAPVLDIAELHAHELFESLFEFGVSLGGNTQAAGIDAEVDVLVHLGRREQHGPLLGALLFGDAVEDAVLKLFHHTDEDALLHQGEIA